LRGKSVFGSFADIPLAQVGKLERERGWGAGGSRRALPISHWLRLGSLKESADGVQGGPGGLCRYPIGSGWEARKRARLGCRGIPEGFADNPIGSGWEARKRARMGCRGIPEGFADIPLVQVGKFVESAVGLQGGWGLCRYPIGSGWEARKRARMGCRGGPEGFADIPSAQAGKLERERV